MIYDSLLASALGGLNMNRHNSSRPSDEEIKKAATEFEALFIYELLKEMPIGKGISGKGLGGDLYDGMFKLELSRELAKRGIGIREMIINAVRQRYNNPSGEL